MTILGLLNGLQHILVQAEGEGAGQNGQGRVRDDGHDGDNREGKENGQDGSQDDAALARVAPVDQIRNCKSNRKTTLESHHGTRALL